MSITSLIVLYAVIWFLTLFVVLPIRLTTQGERGEIVPGTPPSAPHAISMRQKVLLTTGVASVLFLIIAGIILSGAISVRSFDWRGVMPPLEGG